MPQRLPGEPVLPGFRIWDHSCILEQFHGPIFGKAIFLLKVQSIQGFSETVSLIKPIEGYVVVVVLTDFWNLLISLSATVPGLNLWGFLTPPLWETWAVFLAALLASYFLGALAPVFFLAVCFVRAI
jgi:hypothetical protein